MKERYLLIHVDGWCQFVDIEYRDLLAAAHELLECDYIEMATFADGAFIFVLDVVAKLDQKPPNSFATLLYSNKVDFSRKRFDGLLRPQRRRERYCRP